MEDKNKSDYVPSEYVYDEEKKTSVYQNIVEDPCDDSSSENVNRDQPSIRSTTTSQSQTRKSKKRHSRYDEDNYALPDNEEDEPTGSPPSIASQSSNAGMRSKLSLWRSGCCFVSVLLLLSMVGNIVFLFQNRQNGKITIT